MARRVVVARCLVRHCSSREAEHSSSWGSSAQGSQSAAGLIAGLIDLCSVAVAPLPASSAGVRYTVYSMRYALYAVHGQTIYCMTLHYITMMMGASLAWLSVVHPQFIRIRPTTYPFTPFTPPCTHSTPYDSPPLLLILSIRLASASNPPGKPYSLLTSHPLLVAHSLIPLSTTYPTPQSLTSPPHLHAVPLSYHSPIISLHHCLQAFPLIPHRPPGSPKSIPRLEQPLFLCPF